MEGNMQALCGERNCGLIWESQSLVVMRSELLRKTLQKSFSGHLTSLRLLFFSKVIVSVLLMQVKWFLFVQLLEIVLKVF